MDKILNASFETLSIEGLSEDLKNLADVIIHGEAPNQSVINLALAIGNVTEPLRAEFAENVIGHRSIGDEELRVLLCGGSVFGRYNCATEVQNNSTLLNAVCFFKDNIRWHDARHNIDLKVKLPRAYVCDGVYYVGAAFDKTHVFTGRRGNNERILEEYHVKTYSPEMIEEINLHNRFTDNYVSCVISPFCEKYNITLVR